ncbi:hypothetical protein QYF36_024823 [Acer negundo]|nr:hypothetical protein QYF36_024823 [Acer negundo]
MPIMVRMFQNVIKAIKPEGIIVGYPYISFKAKPNNSPSAVLTINCSRLRSHAEQIRKMKFVKPLDLLCVLGLLAPILLKRTLRNIKSTKAEGLIVGYPSSSIIQKSDGAETKIFIDKLDKTGKFEGLKYTYWCTSLVSKVEQAKKLIDGLHKMWLFEGLKDTILQDLIRNTNIDFVEETEIEIIRVGLLLQEFMEYGAMCSGDAYVIEETKSILDTFSDEFARIYLIHA